MDDDDFNNEEKSVNFVPKVTTDFHNDIRRIKQSYRFHIDKLTFANEKIDFETKNNDIIHGEISISIKEFETRLLELEIDKDYYLLAKNLRNIHNKMMKRLGEVRENLLFRFEDMLVRVDQGYMERKRLQEENMRLMAQIEEIRKEKDQIRDKLHSVILEKIENRFSDIETAISMTKSSPKSSVNVQQHQPHNDDNKKTLEITDDDIGTDIDNTDDVSVNKKTFNSEEEENEYKKNVQTAHEEVIEILKTKNLYPLNQQNPKEVYDAYISGEWLYTVKGLEIETDMPAFIKDVSKYKNKPDDYLDNIFEFEKSESKK